MADEDTTTDPGQAFAALMSGAQQAAAPPQSEAPFGWTTDEVTGERRPKKALGRPRKSPPVEELKAAKESGGGPESDSAAPEDRAPIRTRGKRRKAASGQPGETDAAMPQHRPGVITKGVNKLYRRAGKIVRAMDRDIGIAIIESAKNTDEDGGDDSVGAAWDEVARTNPRIRKFLLRIIAGGAWGQLVLAHAPIFMAIIMKDGIRKHVPFMKLVEAMAEPDDDASPQEKAEALNPDDLGEMLKVANGMMAKMGMTVPAPAAGGRRTAPVAPEAA